MFLARPVDKNTIQYFVHIGKILAHDIESTTNDINDVNSKKNLLTSICERLGMTETELAARTGRTILSTARQVASAKYPNEQHVFADVSKEHIQAIAGKFLFNINK